MSERKPAAKGATEQDKSKSSSRGTAGADTKTKGFSAEERAAMKERAKELKAEQGQPKRRSKKDGTSAVLAAIAAMSDPDRSIAQRLHEIVTANAPELAPKTWYGMPAYAKDGKVVCFFQGAEKFQTRYSTLGFNDSANLDEGPMWPTAFALQELTPSVEKNIAALIRRAVA